MRDAWSLHCNRKQLSKMSSFVWSFKRSLSISNQRDYCLFLVTRLVRHTSLTPSARYGMSGYARIYVTPTTWPTSMRCLSKNGSFWEGVSLDNGHLKNNFEGIPNMRKWRFSHFPPAVALMWPNASNVAKNILWWPGVFFSWKSLTVCVSRIIKVKLKNAHRSMVKRYLAAEAAIDSISSV